MRPLARFGFGVALLLAAGCGIPSRDNPHDPKVAAKPQIRVTVDGIEGTFGSRGSAWELDGSATRGRNGASPESACLKWALTLERSDEPPAEESTETEDWTPLAGDDCAVTVNLTPALAGVADFDNGTDEYDGTGATVRWVRLRVDGATE